MSFNTFYIHQPKYSSLSSFLAYDPYIENFWQPILGPTATGLLNLLNLEALTNDESFSISTLELSRRTGTGLREGKSSPVEKQLNRLCSYQLIKRSNSDPNQYEIIPQIPILNNVIIKKLGNNLNIVHDEWLIRLNDDPVDSQRKKVQHLTLIMTMMGYDNYSILNALSKTAVHPSISNEIIQQLSKTHVA